MAIKIQGNTIIDDSRVLINTGNIGVGTTNPTAAVDANNTTIVNAGIVTANFLYGDGSNLTGVGNGGAIIGITVREEGSIVGSAGSVQDINFVGSNLTATSGTGSSLATVTLTDNPNFNGVTVTGVVTASSFNGDGSTLSGIPTSIIAGDNISVSSSTGSVTITGTANTGIISADTLLVTGISTLGIVTGATYFGDGSNLTGIGASQISGAITGITIREEGSVVGSASSIGDINFVSGNLTASASGVGATIILTDDPNFNTVNVTGVVTASSFSGSGVSLTSIPNSALDNSSISFGGVSLDLGQTDATPAFNLSDATSYPYTSLIGITTEIVGDTTPQLGGNLDVNGKDITGTGNVNLTGIVTATSFVGDGSNLTGIGASQIDPNFTNVNVSGILTAANLVVTNTFTSTKLISTGIGISVTNGVSDTATIAGPANLIIDPGTVGDNTGIVRIKGDLYVDGTETIINSTTVEIADKVIGIATTSTSDLLTDGAGIRIGSDKTFLYEFNSGTNPSLKSSENLNVPSGKGYQVNQVEVLNATTLGSGVVNSSLTGVGDLTDLTVTGDITANGDIIGDGATDISGIASVTANEFYGDGSNLTGIGATQVTGAITGITIREEGSVVGVADSINDIDFVSSNLTATASGVGATIRLTDDPNFNGVTVTGFVTASNFSGSGANLSSIPYTSLTGVTTSIVGDTTPQLGGDLDVNGNDIAGTGNVDLTGIITATSFFGDGSGLTGVGGDTATANQIVFKDSSNVATGSTSLTYSGTTSSGVGTVGIGTIIKNIHYDNLNDGTLSWEASEGQLFSITNNLTSGSIFSVNDVSGFPSIDVDANGTIQLAPISTSEYVGIGTTNPTAKLHVVGDGIFDGTGYLQLPSGSTAQRPGSPLEGMLRWNDTSSTFEGYDGSSWGAIGGSGGSGGVSISTNTTNQEQYIPYATSFGSTTGVGATDLFVFNPSTSRLGIGTTNPRAGVDVTDSILVSTGAGVTFDTLIKAYQDELGSLSFEESDSSAQYFSISKDDSTTLFSVNDSSFDAKLIVGAGGSVGIATEDPKAELHVVGDVIITGAINGTSPTPVNNTDDADQPVVFRTGSGSTSGLGTNTSIVINPAPTKPTFSVTDSILVSTGAGVTFDTLIKAYQDELGSLSFEESDSSAQYFSISKDDTTTLFSVNDSSFDTKFIVGAGGSVGIGTEDPIAKLHVVGDARVGVNTSQGIILTSPNGTSYRLIVDNSGVLSTTQV